MTDIAIKVENLSKLYRIGARQNRHDTLRDKLTEVVTAPFRRLSSVLDHSSSVIRHRSSVVNSSVLSHRSSVFGPRSSIFGPRSSVVNSSVLSHRSSVFGPRSSVVFNDTIWALKDVSFSVKRGEVIGIIGRNGAGKTTLLKILSRITEPTEGYAEIHGRVSSLLEVGTGFHPELSGRENIYLNAAILGMKKAEIERKFDEIVAFAEIEKFIDTPVKHYSSGMYVRLAFAVAAHLEPEILLVDEVLAVGDAAFQKKCLGKMGDVAKEGRTVLFVSHNMAAVQNLCKRVFLLSQGKIVSDGATDTIIAKYLSLIQNETKEPLCRRLDRKGNGILRFKDFYTVSLGRGPTDTICTGESVTLVAKYESISPKPMYNVSVSIPFSSIMGQHMFMCWTRMTGQDFKQIASSGEFRVQIPKFPLMPGRYTLNLWCEVNGVLADWVQEASIIDVVEGDFFGTGYLAPSSHGGVVVEHHWSYVQNG